MTTAALCASHGWRLSAHAAAAAARRGFGDAELIGALLAPDVSYPQSWRGDGRELRRRGGIAVVVHVPSRTVITVLLGTTAAWTDADCTRSAAA